ncbi:HAD family hydrolase [Aquibacillus koreensis]|uniref:HAD family hydrolase n=1 Tax=Aquibacillus koreensis TaxID=279446 RepID=A0A9X4AGW8_9BACI|nr:HAD family hydrolase [Aquibacillus koreensis]MCT2534878.1 HAD family hydrolase [Aquibacillus koreensis]MDC3419512.1 HAD family hydrolase [Aquibacillus koreensis]
MIFFDIDATLLDHERAEQMGAIDFHRTFKSDMEYSENEFIERWNSLSEKYFEKFLANELSFQDQRRMRIKDLFGHHLNDEQADRKFNHYLSLYKSNWLTFEDVIPCLQQLKKQEFRLGIISNGDYNQQLEKLGLIKIHHFFDCIVTSSEMGVAKPNPTIFQKACGKAYVQVHESYYIGDRLETDAIGSEKAGMTGIWLNRKNNITHTDVAVIHSLDELTMLLKDLKA